MKHLSTLICIVLLSSSTFGQNIMFLDFDKYHSYLKTKTYLTSHPKVDVLHEQQGDLMLLELSGFLFRYRRTGGASTWQSVSAGIIQV